MGIIPQKVQCARCQSKLPWLFSSVLSLDVENLKIQAAVALASLHYRRSSSLDLHATMMPNLWIVLVQELRVTRAMKFLTITLRPGDQVCQVKS